MREYLENHILDAELIVIVLGALGLAWIVEGSIALNTMLVFLLFFLFLQTGLKISINDLKRGFHKPRESISGTLAILILAPVAGLICYYLFGGPVGTGLLIISLAATSLTVPRAAAERFNSNQHLVNSLGVVTLAGSLITIPIGLSILPIESNTGLMLSNLWIVALPLLIGIFIREYDPGLSSELETHSRHVIAVLGLGFLFASLVFGKPAEVINFQELIKAIGGSGLLISLSTLATISLSMITGVSKKDIVSLAYTSAFKSVPISLFIGVFYGSKVIQTVLLYYIMTWILFFAASNLQKRLDSRIDDNIKSVLETVKKD